MSLARLVVTAVLVEGRSKSEVARSYGLSRPWVHELVTRYLAESEAGLEPRSRRPHTSPTRIPSARRRDRGAPQGVVGPGSGCGRAYDRVPSRSTQGRCPIGPDDLADLVPTRLRHSAAPEATEELVHPVRSGDAE